MQARFLLGPAGSGKTFRCLAEIRAALRECAEGPPLILLAPKQATFQLERQLLADPALAGYTRLQILSFERLAQFVLEQFNIAAPKLLSEEGRVMVLRALLLRHEDELKLFQRSARRPGFAQDLSVLLNEFQQHQLTPAKLRALSQRAGLPDELRGKLHDLALLAEAHANWLAEHRLQDTSCLLDAATEALRKNFSLHPSAIRLSGLWLDGFAEMTPQELDLLAAVLPFCERATLAFCLDEPAARQVENSWLSIWNAVGKTYSQCHQRIERLPDCRIEVEVLPRHPSKNRFGKNFELASLEKDWSRPVTHHVSHSANSALRTPHPAISIAACANPDAEAVFAAREILKFVRAGNRFRDCAVLVRDLKPFHQPLTRAFRRYEIPFFLDRRESVAHHPLAELTRGALRTVAFDWQHDDWFAALKTGFSSADEAEIDRLENESLACGWRGKKWREPIEITDDPALAKSLEKLRQAILPPFETFARQLARTKSKPTGTQLAEALRDLWDGLGVEKTLEKWSAPEAETSSPALRHRSLHATVWEQMNSWLDNLALAFPREPLPLRDWLPVVEAGLAGLTIGVIPPVLDEVLIGAVDRARNPDLRFALVLGLNEGIFSAMPVPVPILTEADRDELNQAVSLGPDLRERLARERYYGYIACTRASEKLAVTFSRQDADGKALNPSPFVAHLKRIFPQLEVEEVPANPDLRDAEHASELAAPIVKFISPHPASGHPLPAGQGKGRGEGRSGNWSKLLEIPALKSLAKALGDLHEPDGSEKLSPALAEKLYGPILQTSVSRLEEFGQCPFRFFVHSGLRAEERKMFELDARERGSFQHEVLKEFHGLATKDGGHWRDLTPAEAREHVAQIAARLVEDYGDGLMRDTAQTRFEAQAMAQSLQDFVAVVVAWMRGQYEFDPAAAELDFGGKASPETAWEIDLGGGRRLALRGRIDRIDLCRKSDEPALAVVMDYKSSNKRLDALLVQHGVQLQLLAYLNVLRHWKNPRPTFGADKLIPTGVFYVNLRGQFESGRTRDEVLKDAGVRKSPYRHTGRFDADALDKLDSRRARDQFNYRLTESGRLYANSVEALSRAEFEKLLDGVETRLMEMGRAIFFGEASVNPYRKGADMPCEFCDYRAACRIDPWTHSWRVLRPVKNNSA